MNNVVNNNVLETFVAISTWQSLVGVIAFITLLTGFGFFMKYVKIKFIYRVLIGLALGFIFGLIVQVIAKFPENGLTNTNVNGKFITNENGEEIPMPNPDRALWAVELNIWVSMFKNIFMNGILMLTAPVVFIAIFKVTSKPGNRGVARITIKGVVLLLINVFFAFIVTFWMGYFLNIGSGSELVIDGAFVKNAAQNKPIPQIIWEYFPSNFAGAWVAGAVIPLMVIGALFGSSIKILSKRKQPQMDAIRNAMNTGWDVIISILMTFMKIMPLAVASMIASSLVSKPIGALASIGKSLGVGYLGLILSAGFITFMIFFSGIKVGAFWRDASKVLVNGFASQSSNATLPIMIGVLEKDMKVNESVVSTIAPLSTSIGMMGCAGVQAGVITSFLWTATSADSDVHSIGLFSYFILSLIITLIASIGIAGVPGTAAVVTAGVLGGLGLGYYFAPVYAVIGALDGMFDMGRTGINVLAGTQVTAIVGKLEGKLEDGSPLLNLKGLEKQKIIAKKIADKEQRLDEKERLAKEKQKAKKQSKTKSK